MIKITTAFVATAALLMTAASAQLTCSLQTEEASITGVEIFSASDFPNKYSHDDDYRFWADVKLTERYDSHIPWGNHHITFRHHGRDCREIKGAKHQICNAEQVEEHQGNSCAQVTHKSHALGWTSGKALDLFTTKSDVHFKAALAPSLQSWSAGLPNTCATQNFDAPDNGYQAITFISDQMHAWDTVVVTLDGPEPNFNATWKCAQSTSLSAFRPAARTIDNGKTWSFTNVRFDPILYETSRLAQEDQ